MFTLGFNEEVQVLFSIKCLFDGKQLIIIKKTEKKTDMSERLFVKRGGGGLAYKRGGDARHIA